MHSKIGNLHALYCTWASNKVIFIYTKGNHKNNASTGTNHNVGRLETSSMQSLYHRIRAPPELWTMLTNYYSNPASPAMIGCQAHQARMPICSLQHWRTSVRRADRSLKVMRSICCTRTFNLVQNLTAAIQWQILTPEMYILWTSYAHPYVFKYAHAHVYNLQ